LGRVFLRLVRPCVTKIEDFLVKYFTKLTGADVFVFGIIFFGQLFIMALLHSLHLSHLDFADISITEQLRGVKLALAKWQRKKCGCHRRGVKQRGEF
jgi:hypothetical protein